MGLFKTFRDMKETTAEHGGMPRIGDSIRSMGKTFDDRGEREILKVGVTASAIVRGFTTTVPGDRYAMQIPLEVHPPSGAPYSLNYVFPTVRMQAPIAAGMEIPIKIDPNDPQRIAVQWDAQQASIAAAGGSTAAVEAGIAKTYGGMANQAMGQALANLKGGQEGAANAPIVDDTQTRLEKLDQLKLSGLIDEKKYQEKKQKIIDEL
jgi:hypothetical protein